MDFKLNRSAVRELLRSDGVLRELERRGHKLAAAAGGSYGVSSFVGRNRARVSVHTTDAAGAAAERKLHTLQRSITAAR